MYHGYQQGIVQGGGLPSYPVVNDDYSRSMSLSRASAHNDPFGQQASVNQVGYYQVPAYQHRQSDQFVIPDVLQRVPMQATRAQTPQHSRQLMPFEKMFPTHISPRSVAQMASPPRAPEQKPLALKTVHYLPTAERPKATYSLQSPSASVQEPTNVATQSFIGATASFASQAQPSVAKMNWSQTEKAAPIVAEPIAVTAVVPDGVSGCGKSQSIARFDEFPSLKSYEPSEVVEKSVDKTQSRHEVIADLPAVAQVQVENDPVYIEQEGEQVAEDDEEVDDVADVPPQRSTDTSARLQDVDTSGNGPIREEELIVIPRKRQVTEIIVDDEPADGLMADAPRDTESSERYREQQRYETEPSKMSSKGSQATAAGVRLMTKAPTDEEFHERVQHLRAASRDMTGMNGAPSISDKLYQEAGIRRAYREELTRLYDENKMRECTFSPVHSTKQSTLPGFQTFSDFFDGQINFIKSREKKRLELLAVAECEKAKEIRFRPEISSRSVSLAKRKRQQNDQSKPLHERLYEEKTSPTMMTMTQEFNKTCTRLCPFSVNETEAYFSPQINKFSQYLAQKRKKSVTRDESLGHVHVHAHGTGGLSSPCQKGRCSSKSREKPTIHLSDNSTNFLISRFIREYERACQEISPTLQTIDFITMINILRFLGFTLFITELNIDNEEQESRHMQQERILLNDMWDALRGDENKGIAKENLIIFLLAILGLHVPVAKVQVSLQEPAEKESQQISTNNENDDQLEIGRFDINGRYSLLPEEVRAIQKVYDLLYANRLYKEQSGKDTAALSELITRQTCSPVRAVKPEVTNNLAEKYRRKVVTSTKKDGRDCETTVPESCSNKKNKPKLLDLFDAEIQRKNEKQAKQEAAKRSEEVRECTFKPNIKRLGDVQSRYMDCGVKPSLLRRDRTTDEINYETHKENCTFKPKTNSSKKDVPIVQPKKEVQQVLKPSAQLVVNGRQDESVRKGRDLISKTFSALGGGTKPKIVAVDVLMTADGRPSKIFLDENADCQSIATEFAIHHGLDEFSRIQLFDLLTRQMRQSFA